MSLPDELLDELLSAHLDDALSGDERARVEQMLRSDPIVAERFDQMKAQRDAVRRAAFAVPKLPSNFADAVVQAAIERAETESLRPEHPLRIAGQNQTVLRAPAEGGWSSTRIVAYAAGIAASVMLVGFLAKRVIEQPGPVQIALDDNPPVGQGPSAIDVPKPLADPGTSVDSGTEIAIASADSPETRDGQALPALPGTSSLENGLAENPTPEKVSPSETLPTDDVNGGALDPDSGSMLADSGNSGRVEELKGSSSSKVRELPVAAPPLNMLFVVSVKLSDKGSDLGAFDTAVGAADIELGNQREVDDTLARAAMKKKGDENLAGSSVRVMLLETSVKKLDVLINRLTSDREGVKSVGFTAISAKLEAPLLRSIESVRSVDPTKIRHKGEGFPIVAQNQEVFDAWSVGLEDRGFASIAGSDETRAMLQMAGGGLEATPQSSDEGPDQRSCVLFLIR